MHKTACDGFEETGGFSLARVTAEATDKKWAAGKLGGRPVSSDDRAVLSALCVAVAPPMEVGGGRIRQHTRFLLRHVVRMFRHAAFPDLSMRRRSAPRIRCRCLRTALHPHAACRVPRPGFGLEPKRADGPGPMRCEGASMCEQCDDTAGWRRSRRHGGCGGVDRARPTAIQYHPRAPLTPCMEDRTARASGP